MFVKIFSAVLLLSVVSSEIRTLRDKERYDDNTFVENCKTEMEEVEEQLLDAAKVMDKKEYRSQCDEFKFIFERCKGALYKLNRDEKTDPREIYDLFCRSDRMKQLLMSSGCHSPRSSLRGVMMLFIYYLYS